MSYRPNGGLPFYRAGSKPRNNYCTLTTVMTGVIMYRPFPVSRIERSPSKSSSMVVAPLADTSNWRFSLTSPDGISSGALRPPVVFVKDGDATEVVRRETYEDLFARDV